VCAGAAIAAACSVAPAAFAEADAAIPGVEVEDAGPPLAAAFEREVTPRLHPPADVEAAYADRLEQVLRNAQAQPAQPEFVVLVDRSRAIQSLMVWWGGGGQPWRLVGAAPVSTGLAGRYEHFETPWGLFVHDLSNPDFRAEGTPNELGIRGYGSKGARVFDFGWVAAAKGWGDRGLSVMRLQLHATDPDRLEQRLGTAQSKGCIRTSASLNRFLDQHAILDGDYDRALAAGATFWVLREDREVTAWSGRLLVVVDSKAAVRPDWSRPPASASRRRAAPAASAATP
jgi:hypothetical protein